MLKGSRDEILKETNKLFRSIFPASFASTSTETTSNTEMKNSLEKLFIKNSGNK